MIWFYKVSIFKLRHQFDLDLNFDLRDLDLDLVMGQEQSNQFLEELRRKQDKD
jgi:hypothetical protein